MVYNVGRIKNSLKLLAKQSYFGRLPSASVSCRSIVVSTGWARTRNRAVCNHNFSSSTTLRSATSSSSVPSTINLLREEMNQSDVSITSESKQRTTFRRVPVVPYLGNELPKLKFVPSHIERPPYAKTGYVGHSRWTEEIMIHNTTDSIQRMKDAAQLAATVLQIACDTAGVGQTTDEIDTIVHNAIIKAGAYPSPLNYSGFPKSVCTSINEIICHGIPDHRPLQNGDVISFDVSCYYNGVHGDNCATIVVGDKEETNNNNDKRATKNFETTIYDDHRYRDNHNVDWRGVPHKSRFDSIEEKSHFHNARRLVQATREGLYAGIKACSPGGCLSDIGAAIEDVALSYGYSSIRKYRGHGISHEFHTAPFVKHYRNTDRCPLVPGMIFTIEPMFVDSSTDDCFEWESDNWTVSTIDGSLAAQFEHTVLITETGVEILTIPSLFWFERINEET